MSPQDSTGVTNEGRSGRDAGTSRRPTARIASVALLTLILATGLAVVAGTAAADAAVLQEDQELEVEIESFNGTAANDTVVVSPGAEGEWVRANVSNYADHGALNFSWSHDGAGTFEPLTDNAKIVEYEFAEGDVGERVQVDVTATGSEGQSGSAEFAFVVRDVNQPPVADLALAGSSDGSQPIVSVEDGTVELTAAGSTDADGDELTYEWTSDGAVDDSRLTADGQTATYELDESDVGETLAFSVTASDGEAADTAELSVVVDGESEGDLPEADVMVFTTGDDERAVVNASTEEVVFDAFMTEPRDDKSNVTFEWDVVEGDGELVEAENFSKPLYVTYHVADADVGSEVTVSLTASYEGRSDVDTATVQIGETNDTDGSDDQSGDDGTDDGSDDGSNDDGSDDDGSDDGSDDDGSNDDSNDSPGGSIGPPGGADDSSDDQDDSTDQDESDDQNDSDDQSDSDESDDQQSDDEETGQSDQESGDDPATAPGSDGDADDGTGGGDDDGGDGGLGTATAVLIVGVIGSVGAIVYYFRP